MILPTLYISCCIGDTSLVLFDVSIMLKIIFSYQVKVGCFICNTKQYLIFYYIFGIKDTYYLILGLKHQAFHVLIVPGDHDLLWSDASLHLWVKVVVWIRYDKIFSYYCPAKKIIFLKKNPPNPFHRGKRVSIP